MVDVSETQLLRAVANAIWPDYRRGKWKPNRNLTVNDPTGNPSSHRYAPANFPGPKSNPRVEPTEDENEQRIDEPNIRAVIYPAEWPGAIGLLVQLLKRDADNIEVNLPPEQGYQLKAAKKLCKCRYPFELSTNRHGQPRLRRNSHDPLMTAEAAAALERIAGAASTERLTHEQLIEHSLITEEEIPESIDALSVFAAAERASRT